jgi:hypothetical protein
MAGCGDAFLPVWTEVTFVVEGGGHLLGHAEREKEVCESRSESKTTAAITYDLIVAKWSMLLTVLAAEYV